MKSNYTRKGLASLNGSLNELGIKATSNKLNSWMRLGLLPNAPEAASSPQMINDRVQILALLPQPPAMAFKDLQSARFVLGDIDEQVALAARLTWLTRILPIVNTLSSHGIEWATGAADLFVRRVNGFGLSASDNKALMNLNEPQIPASEWFWSALQELNVAEANVVIDFISAAVQNLEPPDGRPEVNAGALHLNKSGFLSALNRLTWFNEQLTVPFLKSKYSEVKREIDFYEELDVRWIQAANLHYMDKSIAYLYVQASEQGLGPRFIAD